MNILVTGGAGYIGSHAVQRLLRDGHTVIALDNLFRGHIEAMEALKPTAGGRRRWQRRGVTRGVGGGAVGAVRYDPRARALPFDSRQQAKLALSGFLPSALNQDWWNRFPPPPRLVLPTARKIPNSTFDKHD